MGNLIKLGFGAAVVAVLFYGYSAVKKAAESFGFQIVGYGTPQFNGLNDIDLPVVIRFNNPSPVAVQITNVSAQLYVNMGGTWQKTATVNQPLSVPAGTSDQKVNAKIDLSSFFKGGLLSLLTTANTVLATKSIPVRADVTVTVGNLQFPAQTFTQSIQVG